MLRELNMNEMQMVNGGNQATGVDWEAIHDTIDLNNNGSIAGETALGVVVGAPLAAGGAAIAGASAGVAALVGTAAGTIISVGGFFTSWASNQSSGSSGNTCGGSASKDNKHCPSPY